MESSEDSAATAPTTTETAGTASTDDSPAETCALSTLPVEAQDVIETIKAGGPFDYPSNDGARFGNYEGHLPAESSNYYREYTVTTPHISHRGTRRIVTGGGSQEDPDVWYYTSDHYESFCAIPDAENTS